jgi:hypothetical protein
MRSVPAVVRCDVRALCVIDRSVGELVPRHARLVDPSRVEAELVGVIGRTEDLRGGVEVGDGDGGGVIGGRGEERIVGIVELGSKRIGGDCEEVDE